MKKQNPKYEVEELRLLVVAVGTGVLGSMASNAIFLFVQKTSLITQAFVYLFCIVVFLVVFVWLIVKINKIEKNQSKIDKSIKK